MKIACRTCGQGPRDGVEIKKVAHGRWLCIEHLRTDLIGVRLWFKLRREGHVGCQDHAPPTQHRELSREVRALPQIRERHAGARKYRLRQTEPA